MTRGEMGQLSPFLLRFCSPGKNVDDEHTSVDSGWLESRSVSDSEWLNTDQAAKRLGITTRTLYRFIDEGQVAAYRFGRVFRLMAADIDDFIEKCRVEPGTLSHLYPERLAGSDGAENFDGDVNLDAGDAGGEPG